MQLQILLASGVSPMYPVVLAIVAVHSWGLVSTANIQKKPLKSSNGCNHLKIRLRPTETFNFTLQHSAHSMIPPCTRKKLTMEDRIQQRFSLIQRNTYRCLMLDRKTMSREEDLETVNAGRIPEQKSRASLERCSTRGPESAFALVHPQRRR